MKKRTIILLMFLMMLFVVPPASATYGDESPQSITSFSETLPDDVLFYPDGFNSSEILASEGDYELTSSDSYVDTHVLDASSFEVWSDTSAPCNGYIWLNFSVPTIESADIFVNVYCLYKGALVEIDAHNVSFYNGSDWVEIGDIPADFSYPYTSYDWVNVSIPSASLTDNKVMIRFWVQESFIVGINIDYAEIKVQYMTLSDSNHYAESFASVDDWTYQSDDNLDPGQYGFGSDSDVGELWADFQDADNEYVVYEYELSTAVSIESYMEHRFKSETNNVMMYIQIVDSSAATYYVTAGGVATTWYTGKTYLGASGLDDIKKVRLRTDDTTSATTGNLSIYWDYLRISPADEMGWQHDGSTTEGVTDQGAAGYTYSESSDGDILTLTATQTGAASGWAYFYIGYDTTATKTTIERDYYPFLEVRYNISVMAAARVVVVPHVDGKTVSIETEAVYKTSTVGWTTFRMNVLAMTTVTGADYILVYVRTTAIGQTATINIDYAKYYSIANYTYTGTGVSIDDVLYVSSSTLYCSGTSFTSIVLDHDPALSVDTENYTKWNVTTSSGTPQFDYYVSAWQGYSSETSGQLIPGTLTDIRLKFTAVANIEAIKFIDTKLWQEVDSKTGYIHVPFDYWAFDMLLIILGLGLIVLSSVYAAYKIKNNPTRDTILIVILFFIFGIGLFFGGIGLGG